MGETTKKLGGTPIFLGDPTFTAVGDNYTFTTYTEHENRVLLLRGELHDCYQI